MTKEELKDYSPMMQHHLQTKEKYQDCVLFYRLGDFYELFFEDALECSRVLGLTLTKKDCGKGKQAPMCGVPVKALDTYLAKLIDLGYKIAICEQLTEAKKGEAVDRDVVRVITPGTVVEGEILDGTSNNFLAVIYQEKNNVGVSYIDISTGEFNTVQFDNNIVVNINDLFSTVRPKEIIANKTAKAIEDELSVVQMQVVPNFTYLNDDEFEFGKNQQMLLSQLKANSLKEIDCANKQFCVISAGALLNYVITTQKRDLAHINHLNLLDVNKYMQIDANSRRNLELTENSKDRGRKGTLLSVLDRTRTNMGKRTLKNFINNPLKNDIEINYRLKGVEELVKNIVARENLREYLYNIYDIERLTGRVCYNNLTPKDCLSLAKSLNIIPDIKQTLAVFNSDILKDLNSEITDLTSLSKLLTDAIDDNATNNIKDGGFIKKGFNAELDELVTLKNDTESILSKLENEERQKTGIKNLKIGYNKVFGYYIEVSKMSVDMVPYRYVRKQTLVNGERYITEELKAIEDKLLNAETRMIEIELELFDMIRKQLLTYVKQLQSTARAIAVLDVLTSFATVSVERNYVKPIVSKSNKNIEIIEGRHPVVETILKGNFVPNDTIMNNSDSRIMLITGPNMAGKSTYMRQVALITIMAQIGCFVPAKSAKLSITDRIFTRIGASDDLLFGQSTFMVEMTEVSNILKYATNDSLILLDEIGRGTSTFDGLSIAWAVIEFISKNFYSKTLFSTHFHELTELEGVLDGLKNYKIQVKEYDNQVIFLRKIVRGSANKSFGIEVAALAGLPEELLNRAKEILHTLEQNDLNSDLINNTVSYEKSENVKQAEYRKALNEIGGILNDVNVNTLTPLNAFDLVLQLKNYLKKE